MFPTQLDASFFGKIRKCMEDIAITYHKNIIDILYILEGDPEFKGIREWFNRAGKEVLSFPLKKTKLAYPSDDQKRAEEELQSFSLLATGARKGDMVIGLRTQSKNSILQLLHKDVPPEHRTLDAMRSFENIWIQFLDKLNTIPYFSKMTLFEKEMYFEYAQRMEDIYFDDIPDLKIKVLDIGDAVEGGFPQLPPSDIEYLLRSEDGFLVEEITSLFPRKPGSSGIKGRHTLIFRRGLWKIYFEAKEVSQFKGIVIDVGNASIKDFAKKSLSKKLFVFENLPKTFIQKKGYVIAETQEVCIQLSLDSRKQLEKEDMIENAMHALQIFGIAKVEPSEVDAIFSYFDCYSFTPAGYKSLLQKIIRFGPREEVLLSHGKSVYPPVLLVVTIASLFLHPGSFVPDIQRYVSGIESAFKRVAVSILEDSYLSPASLKDLASSMICAFLAQRVKSWKPHPSYIQKCFRIALESYFSLKAFVWDIQKGLEMPPIAMDASSTPLQITSAMLDEIRSFSGDLGLTRYLAYQKELSFTEASTSAIPISMPMEHCIDQHWAPEIAYLYEEYVIKENAMKGNRPFSKLFIRIFSEVTGINPFRPPRKGITMDVGSYDSFFEEREFVKETRKAQRNVMLSKNKREPSRFLETSKKDFFELHYSFGPEWIAGMIGVMEAPSTKKGPVALVTLSPSHLRLSEVECYLVAIRKPFREMKNPFLSDERAEEAIEYAKDLLKKGVLVKDTCIPIHFLKGAVCSWDDESSQFLFLLKDDASSIGGWKSWKDVFTGIQTIPYIIYPDPFPETWTDWVQEVFTSFSDGIHPQTKRKIKEWVDATPIPVLSKLISYLSNKSVIEFKKLGRDGGGSASIVTPMDIFAYHLFLKIALLLPFAFSRKKGSALDFYVMNKAGVLFVINEIRASISLRAMLEKETYTYGGNVGDTKGRVLWEHQEEAIEQLKENIEKGRKGSFLWLPVGSGKTMIVLEYLLSKIKNKTIPPYIIYTLPSSAMQSIIHEIESYQFPYKVLIPLKNAGKYSFSPDRMIKDCVPVAEHINLIEQDHLRLCEDVLSEYVKDSIFIIDEVHKALNDTKRTATALQFSHLSQEFIALTGTPIIDSNTYKLMWWLEQIVPFEVNQHNFWVAANDIISRKFVTGVIVRHVDYPMKFSFEEETTYKKLVPPALGGTQEHARPSDFQKAMELCYSVANRGIIETVRKMLSQKRGCFVVAKDIKHQQELYERFLSEKVVEKDSIFLITSSSSLFLTDDAVAAKQVPDYKVVITTVRKSAGYTLTHLSAMVTSVYPSNNADREQLEGRINRIGQKSPDVIITTVHCGILSYILSKHMDAKNLSAVLSALAADIQLS